MSIKETNVKMLPIGQLVTNDGQIEGVPANPRQISKADFEKLKASLRANDLTGVMPLKVYPQGEQYVVLGGNMRLRALQELGAAEVSCIVLPENTDVETLREVVIVDNSTFGEWDIDLLADQWDESELRDWGVSVPMGAGGELDEDGNYQSEEMTEYEQAQILNPEDEYIIITCRPEEFDDMRAHFGCGYIRPLEAGKRYREKRERARVVKWSDYVSSNTK